MSEQAESEAEERRKRDEFRFLRLWRACQPTLFPEWEREMDRRDAEEYERRQEEAAARTAKRVSRASEPSAPPR